ARGACSPLARAGGAGGSAASGPRGSGGARVASARGAAGAQDRRDRDGAHRERYRPDTRGDGEPLHGLLLEAEREPDLKAQERRHVAVRARKDNPCKKGDEPAGRGRGAPPFTPRAWSGVAGANNLT